MQQPVKMLIVEDEALTAMRLNLELSLHGYANCQIVATGEEALTIVDQQHPDIVLMDISLAGDLDGIETARHIKSHKDIPIIFMTGYTDPEVQTRAQALHPAAYFVKPVNMTDLTTAINSALRKS
ncbi:response regulator [candidate division KSB3 bacterium]|uniref:Response regulator n=1 Tax=candidate division KSB3 bacterium TaxID=2044937 RepID=A0A9D5JTE9_9BACT|nr:response regulator [candidate division KSB3 bacterium]MBD3323913.1 response regulator [candidate division KSB3 bacterium]